MFTICDANHAHYCHFLCAYATMTASLDEPPHVESETNIFFKLTEKNKRKNKTNERVVSLLHYF